MEMEEINFDDGEPEREALDFNFEAEDQPPEMIDAMVKVKEVAEKLLYHWRTFPVILPPSITDSQQAEERDGDHVISFKDLFISPTFDELEIVARDKKGNLKHLNDKQLDTIRQTGEFEIESTHFPGQTHRWRLSQLLQKGVVRSQETLLNDAALSLRLLIITARNRFVSHFFSLSQSIRAIGKCIWQLLDVLIGMPYTTHGNLVTKVQEEHSRFLVAELNIRSVCKRDWFNYCEYLKEKCSSLEADKHKTTDVKPPPVPYRFQTAKGNEIDLRLFNKDLFNQCCEVLKRILERESRGWYIKYKDRLITELKGQNLTFTEISDYVNKAIMEEYKRRVFEAVSRNEELENIQPKIGSLLVEQAKASLAINKAVEDVRSKLYKHQDEHQALLVKTYPVRSRIEAWMNERLQEFREDYIRQNQWCAHEQAIEECRQQGLVQAVYFLQRDLIYMRDREPVLMKELSKVRNPLRVFSFAYRIWLPKNWVIRRSLYGESEEIPTLIVRRSAPSQPSYSVRGSVDGEPTYDLEKYVYRRTSTRYPFWRWNNYFHRTWAYTWNAIFWLGVVIPWCSPVSLRALLFLKAFMPDLELSQVNGTLYPLESSKTQTMVSRLQSLWTHVRHSRTKFESEPDTGFLGKSFTRHVNRVWNYFVKGALGSTLVVLVSIPTCVGASFLSVCAALTAPLWMPVATLVYHLFHVIVYDFDHPKGRPDNNNSIMYLFEALIYRLLIQGLLQPIGATLAGLIVCPLGAFFVSLAAVLKRGSRAVWDAFMFHAVIKKRGRVPCKDGFVAKRISGPGLASNYFYQVRPEQALAAVESCMEEHEVRAYRDNMVKVVEKPMHEFEKFVSQCFSPFSAALVETKRYRFLKKETQEHLSKLQKTVESRQKRLRTGLTHDIQTRIKLSARELKVTIAQTAKMLEGFYPEHVLDRLSVGEEEFWESRHLEAGDWQGLATQLLTEIFSSSFLTPLEEADTCFKLEVQHLNLGRYIEMLKSAEFRDDLDVVSMVHTPKGDIDVDAPYLHTYTFSPNKERVHYAESLYYASGGNKRWPWKRKTLRLSEIEKLESPVPIAHPAVIAVIFHNREHDQETIDLEDPFCQRILSAAEQLPYTELRDPMYEGDGEVSTPDHTTNSDPEGGFGHLAEQESTFSESHGPSPLTSGPESPESRSLGSHSAGQGLPGSSVGSFGSHTPGSVTPGSLTPGSLTPGSLTPGSLTPGSHTPGHDSTPSDLSQQGGESLTLMVSTRSATSPASGATSSSSAADDVPDQGPDTGIDTVVDVAKEEAEAQQSTPDESRVVYTENESNNSCVVDVDEDESSSADEGEGAATSLAYMLKYGHDIDKSGTI